jgi:vacuolar-type H+-ATPase subunit F/Vma7
VAVPVAIADEITAAGLRLAGVETVVFAADELPQPPEPLWRAFDAACRAAPLVLVTAELARHLPRARLEAALAAEAPLVAVIPDIEERSLAPDVAAEVGRALGVSP